MEDVDTPLPQHLESKWLVSLRSYLASIKAHLYVDSPGVPPIEREKDTYIMDKAVHSGLFLPSELRRINYCRMFLQAVTILDLTKTEGYFLDMSKLVGTPDKRSESTWILWKKANRLWSDTLSVRLLETLGQWMRTIHESQLEHFAYGYQNRVAVRMSDGYMECWRMNPKAVLLKLTK
jgi:hypothetical protein